MTNRDKLYKLCTYDLLCRINNGLSDIDGIDICVINALINDDYSTQYCYKNQCHKCILDWLDKDVNNE